MQTEVKKSWFKQFWPWFLIILPMAAVVAGISTFIIASDNKPDMVVDDYYKTGKAINADLSLLTNAKKLGLSAEVVQQADGLLIKMKGLETNTSISFSLFHSTQSKRDKLSMLTADAEGNYHFETDQPLEGKWSLRLEPFDKKWRLEKKVIFPSEKITL
ncbi:FixH family protein [uncultured Psychromonas sp.]|uniref:FixH family protein n=1 Tax=uncultured Psychromonas sp. TaxID=173974 RepID=UPI00260209D8|nr:FixH family protein [uncultured Psychromonas sp.]